MTTPTTETVDAPVYFWVEGLFSTHFLTERLPVTEGWASQEDTEVAWKELRAVWQAVGVHLPKGNEEDVEDRLVAPVLKVLGFGWEKRRALATKASAGRHFPDFLLYASPDDAKNAFQTGAYWDSCIGLLEAKRWATPLQTPASRKERSPHLQLRDYLNERPELGWGMVTNGGEWRLYARDAPASEFIAVDLRAILEADETNAPAQWAFRLFYTLWQQAAWLNEAERLRDWRVGAERFREEIEAQLRRQVFDATEMLATGFLANPENQLGPTDLPEVFENTLVLLYRLLFALNAEARDLLPTDPQSAYFRSYGMEAVRRKLARHDTAAEYEDEGSFALWGRANGLWTLINGDVKDRNERLGVPRYNGGLFDPARYPFLQQKQVGDRFFAHALQTLTFRKEADGRITAFDYAGLGERHLGSIYEGLLEHTLRMAGPAVGAAVTLRNDKNERKIQGAYYTPQEWVAYLVRQTLSPLLARADADAAQTPDKFAEAVLRLNVCDPAMGSGHFLVEATGQLADAIASHPTTATGDAAYWRRRVVEACIYGVDRNPLAVELAKLSLWLKTVDRVPLNFLDHHLRCGDSLVGTTLESLPHYSLRNKAMAGKGKAASAAPVQLSFTFAGDLEAALREAIAGIHAIESVATDTHETAKTKEKRWRELSETILPRFTAVADLWMTPYFGGDLSWLRYQSLLDDPQVTQAIRAQYGAILDRVRPFHWDLAFPDVFFDDKGVRKADPGFDAVVGNPPWERIKLSENEFFSSRSLVIAQATRAADRKALIAGLPQTDPELWQAWTDARRATEQTLRFVQTSGFYPLMGRGDTNLYAVFVEQATRLAARRGRVGLLVPSGIATDNTTAPFFRHIVQGHRLAELLDFENKGGAFPDVDSRFKFSVFILAGEGDPQPSARCGFFLHTLTDADDPDRVFPLTPDDFARFNPNTLTCPIFRRRRDIELSRKLYESAPILIRRASDSGHTILDNPWGVRFSTMFHMTNDSNKFQTRPELEKAGFWLGDGNVFTKGNVRYLPLYEGKMVQMYDHRAAGVKINPANLHRAAQEDPSTLAQHQDPDFSPLSQYWVNDEDVKARFDGATRPYLIAFKDVTAPTNARTFIPMAIPFRRYFKSGDPAL